MSPAADASSKKPTKAAAKAEQPAATTWRKRIRWALLTVLGGVALGGGSYAVWKSVGQDVLRHEQYQLKLEQFTVTPPPQWIRTDIRAEVFQQGGFEEDVWLHDPNLAEQIAKTFALHPWIAKVDRVSVRGATVQVDLTYRKPVCMVEVPGGVFPVDVDGVLLPRDDFTPSEARGYPRLAGITKMPAGLVGMPWGDLHVVGGAEIAAALTECWAALPLDHIAVVNSGSPDILFELAIRPGSRFGKDRVVWGHAPSAAEAHEPSAEQKIAMLKDFFADKPTADGQSAASAARELDLRRLGPARTALHLEADDDERGTRQ